MNRIELHEVGGFRIMAAIQEALVQIRISIIASFIHGNCIRR